MRPSKVWGGSTKWSSTEMTVAHTGRGSGSGRKRDSSRVAIWAMTYSSGPCSGRRRLTPSVRRHAAAGARRPARSGTSAAAITHLPYGSKYTAPYLRSAATTVWCSSTAIVMGPTPPGTGVRRLALVITSSKATSPTLPSL